MVPAHHSIVYGTRDEPDPLPLEVELGVDEDLLPSIRVLMDDPQETLDPESRMNYSELYTVQFNTKVMAVGWIHDDSEDDFDVCSWRVLGPACFPAMVNRMQVLREAVLAAQE